MLALRSLTNDTKFLANGATDTSSSSGKAGRALRGVNSSEAPAGHRLLHRILPEQLPAEVDAPMPRMRRRSTFCRAP